MDTAFDAFLENDKNTEISWKKGECTCVEKGVENVDNSL